MPELPVFLANALEPRFARPAVVTDIHVLAPRLRRVRFEGPALQGVSFRPGQEIEFRVSDRAFRHYTPASFDRDAGHLEVVFFTHGHGPGSTWSRALERGHHVNVLGPGGRFGLRDARAHVLLGDETTLGLFACLARAARGDLLGAVEVDPDGRDFPQLTDLPLLPVVRTAARGDALARWLESADLPDRSTTCIYLAGHTGSIVKLRADLRRRGWPRASIRTKPYWADGKRGL